MHISIVEMPGDDAIRLQSATWAVEEWKRDFPYDTVDWYLNLYTQSDSSASLPVVLAAFLDNEFVGSASLIADDELPDAPEPGPWVAAVYVAESARGQGIGARLVKELLARAGHLGIQRVYLYTQHGAPWYETMGWTTCRIARLQDHDVTVMTYEVLQA
jgi:GNAT superfamily N-acetyltransferase